MTLDHKAAYLNATVVSLRPWQERGTGRRIEKEERLGSDAK